MNRKMIRLLVVTVCLMGTAALAKDVFPPFSEGQLTVAIPTNTPGLLADSSAEAKGTNIIYRITGQIVTNSSEGHIQSQSEGFSGKSDKSTPWKTLTDLFYVYQQGSHQDSLRSLYAKSSQDA